MRYWKVLPLFLILWMVSGCHSSKRGEEGKLRERPRCTPVKTGAGPEDLVLRRDPEGVSLYISSHERRRWKEEGQIYRFRPESREMKVIPREGEPEDLYFAPHGIDLSQKGDLLYVISHGKKRNDDDQSILMYEIKPDRLTFRARIRSPGVLVSPNDLAVTPEGKIYVSNDARTRGSVSELLLKRRVSSVAYCDPEGGEEGSGACRIVADGLGMANGVAVEGEELFVATTRENLIYRFRRKPDGSLVEKRVLTAASGPDNLSFAYDRKGMRDPSKLLVAEHISMKAFLFHMLFGSPSPSRILLFDRKEGRAGLIYSDDGREISTASGAILDGRRLYLSQVFDGEILECSLP